MAAAPPHRRRVAIALAGALAAAGAGACAAGSRTARGALPSAEGAPEAGEGPLARGDAARRAGDVDAALGLYLSEVERDPASIRAHLRYVSTAIAADRDGEARATYRRRAVAPGALEADRVMAARLATDGSPAAVRAVYVESARAAPEDPWWRLALAEIDLAAADRWIRRGGDARAAGDRATVEGARDLALRALSRADAALDHATARDPSIPEIDLYRGLAASLRADLASASADRVAGYRAAADAFARATRGDPGLLDAWVDLADAWARAGDAGAALGAWREAIRRAPADPDLRDGAGIALHDLGRHAEAAAQFAESAHLRPRDPRPLLDEGDTWAAAGRWEQALDAYARALARDAGALEAHAKRGAVLERLGRAAEAREAYSIYVARGGRRVDEIRRRLERLVGAGGGAR